MTSGPFILSTMAATGSGPNSGFASRSGLPTFGNFGSTLLERAHPGLRKSTPDSEALASSDEEVDQSRLRSAAHRKTGPNRRSSLLMDHNSSDSRRLSLAGGGGVGNANNNNNSYSPATGSQPNTPGASNDTWSSISPGVGAWNTASAYPFGTNIWGANSRDPPARLQEVRQESHGGESRLPFTIPSQPNASVQRSMSFSVGQTEYDTASNASDPISRPTQGLIRRSSRQSNLGHEFGGLPRVSESEDNEHFFSGMSQTTIQNQRLQTRAMSNNSNLTASSSGFRGNRLRNPALEVELAVDEIEEPTAQLRQPTRGAPSRRLSDFQAAALPIRQPNGLPFSSTNLGNNRSIPHWSSNLDFGQLDTIPQSRRHSFADVPTRRGSMGSNEDEEEEDNHSASYDAGSQALSQDHEASYFDRNDAARRATEQEVQQQLQQEHHQAIFGLGSPYGITSNSSNIGSFNGPHQPLYIVNFKCCRSDIYYIQEGTGLTVKEGNLVIVEADRGTDLGCVQHANISWEAARKYKAKYAEQHFGWLMMFSQQSRSGAPNLFNPNAVAPGRGGSNQQGTTVRESDLKTKMIKRLAQPHEIQALQEKEGNEAKAKRVCQQKVVEHSLNMEILDAEFQMDGKKLTFYFFSNEYINFNSLVTDLFKMYKTRIWMSAINPASFQSPVASLGITPIYGNTGLGVSNTPTTANFYDDGGREDQRYSQPAPPPQPMAPQREMRVMPPLYYGGYGQPPQMNDFGGYGATAYQQPNSDPFSGYSAPLGYGMPNTATRGPHLPISRPDPNGRSFQMPPSSNNNGNSLATQFGSLSLAR